MGSAARHLVEGKEAVAPPALPQQPAVSGRHRRRLARRRPGPEIPPAVEPWPGAAGVDPVPVPALVPLGAVSAAVEDHIADGGPYLPRRPESAREVAIGKDAAAAAEGRVEPPRDADAQPLEPPRQRLGVLGLDDEVQVVLLHGEVHQPEAEALLGRAKAGLDEAIELGGAQAGQVFAHREADMHRMARGQPGPPQMRGPAVWLSGPTRAWPPAAPAAEGQAELAALRVGPGTGGSDGGGHAGHLFDYGVHMTTSQVAAFIVHGSRAGERDG